MFSESMLSISVSKAEDPEATSYLPAFLAIGCGWLVALVRGVLGLVQHEGFDSDMALTTLALTVIPLIVFYIWRAARPRVQTRSDASRRRRPRLVVISNHSV